jgi:hypothetical protein
LPWMPGFLDVMECPPAGKRYTRRANHGSHQGIDPKPDGPALRNACPQLETIGR